MTTEVYNHKHNEQTHAVQGKLILLTLEVKECTLPLQHILAFQEKGQIVHKHRKMVPLKQKQIYSGKFHIDTFPSKHSVHVIIFI